MVKQFKHSMKLVMLMAGLVVFNAQGTHYTRAARLFMGKLASSASAQAKKFNNFSKQDSRVNWSKFQKPASSYLPRKTMLGISFLGLVSAHAGTKPYDVNLNHSSEYVISDICTQSEFTEQLIEYLEHAIQTCSSAEWEEIAEKLAGHALDSHRATQISYALTVAWAKHPRALFIQKLQKKFFQKHPVEISHQHIESILNVHQNNIVAYQQDWLPGWFIKRDESNVRIIGAEIFSKAIKELGYSNFIVPRKYPYAAQSGEKYAIAKKIKDSKEPINLNEIQQLIEFTIKTRWSDAHAGNIIKTPEGKIAFIDTEAYYIGGHAYDKEERKNKYLAFVDEYTFRYQMLGKLSSLRLTPEAQEYLEEQDKKYTYIFNNAYEYLSQSPQNQEILADREKLIKQNQSTTNNATFV